MSSRSRTVTGAAFRLFAVGGVIPGVHLPARAAAQPVTGPRVTADASQGAAGLAPIRAICFCWRASFPASARPGTGQHADLALVAEQAGSPARGSPAPLRLSRDLPVRAGPRRLPAWRHHHLACQHRGLRLVQPSSGRGWVRAPCSPRSPAAALISAWPAAAPGSTWRSSAPAWTVMRPDSPESLPSCGRGCPAPAGQRRWPAVPLPAGERRARPARTTPLWVAATSETTAWPPPPGSRCCSACTRPPARSALSCGGIGPWPPGSRAAPGRTWPTSPAPPARRRKPCRRRCPGGWPRPRRHPHRRRPRTRPDPAAYLRQPWPSTRSATRTCACGGLTTACPHRDPAHLPMAEGAGDPAATVENISRLGPR